MAVELPAVRHLPPTQNLCSFIYITFALVFFDNVLQYIRSQVIQGTPY